MTINIHHPGATHAFVAREVCGCISLAVVDDPGTVKRASREFARARRLGLTIERITVEQVREQPWWDRNGCVHTRQQKSEVTT